MEEKIKSISIIIPVFNGEVYIAGAIRTALNQDYLNKEVIVINDGSTDKTAEICQVFEGKIIYYEQENRGLGASRNQGVLLAKGQYIAFLDCDDLWESTKLSRQMQNYAGDTLHFTMIKQFYCSSLSDVEKSKIAIPQEILPGYCGSCLLLSRKLFEKVGQFHEKKEVGEFIEWYSRAMALNTPVQLIEEVLAYRRVHAHNMGRQRERYSRQEYLKVLKKNLELRRQKGCV